MFSNSDPTDVTVNTRYVFFSTFHLHCSTREKKKPLKLGSHIDKNLRISFSVNSYKELKTKVFKIMAV